MGRYKITIITSETATGKKIDEYESYTDNPAVATSELYRIRNHIKNLTCFIKTAKATTFDIIISEHEDDGTWSVFQAKRMTI